MLQILERICVVAVIFAALLSLPRIEQFMVNYATAHRWFRRALFILAWVLGVGCGLAVLLSLGRLGRWVWTGRALFS